MKISEMFKTIPPKPPSKKRSYESMSQKQLDHALDAKIIEYLSAGSNSKSSQDQSPVPVVTAEEAFGKSVVAQLLLLEKET